VDHVIPKVSGGKNVYSNLQLATLEKVQRKLKKEPRGKKKSLMKTIETVNGFG
jgi:5-methylcytosine-specific restriction endonuclease McrA